MFADSLPDSIIKRLSIRAKELGAVNLGQGIPSFATPPHIIAAAKEALDDPAIGVYPNFLGEIALREAIAKRTGRDVTEILVTVGAMEGTATAILSLVENGDHVGVVTPDYCNHFPQITLARGSVVPLPLLEDAAWTLDLTRIEKEAKQGLKLLVLTNPGNPTGFVASKDELATLVRLANTYGFWILADETYSYLTYGTPYVSLLSFWNESERLMVIRTFSKEYAMTGWRVGYVAASKAAIRVFSRVHDSLTGCVTKVSQRAAIAALGGPQDFVINNQPVYARRRQMAMEAMQSIPGLTLPAVAGAYYAFPRYRGTEPSSNLCERLLTGAGVAAVPGYAFGEGGEGHFRISFAASDSVLAEGLSRLVKFFAST